MVEAVITPADLQDAAVIPARDLDRPESPPLVFADDEGTGDSAEEGD